MCSGAHSGSKRLDRDWPCRPPVALKEFTLPVKLGISRAHTAPERAMGAFVGGRMRLFRFAAMFVLLIAVNAAAQSNSGSMFGSVVDASGAAVPGADVTITHEHTGEKRNTVSGV